MKYMLLLYSAPDAGPTPGTPEQAAEMKEWFAFTDAVAQAGALVSGEPLQGSDSATTVRVRNGETVTTDGPFAESKEHIAGFYIINAEDLDAALAWADKVVAAIQHPIEVRPFRATGKVADNMPPG